MKECPKCDLCYGDEVAVCQFDQTQTRLSLPGGQLIADRYWLEKRLGRGAMGQVYLARDKKFDRRAKLSPASNARLRQPRRSSTQTP